MSVFACWWNTSAAVNHPPPPPQPKPPTLLDILEFVWILNLNENIYKITHVFQHQQLDCCFKSLFSLTTKKTSRHRINSLLWGDCDWIACYQNITASCILHNILNANGHIWTNLYLLSTIQIWWCCVNTSHHSDVTWGTRRLKSPETWLLFLDSTTVTSKLSIIGPLWGESTSKLFSFYHHYHHHHHFHHYHYYYHKLLSLLLFSIIIVIVIIVIVSVFVIMIIIIIIITIIVIIIIITVIILGIINHQCMLHNMVRFGHNDVTNSGFQIHIQQEQSETA